MQRHIVIAIDGPSGVGKSTVARSVAAELGLSCVESGAMYRAVALLALESGTPLGDATALGGLARSADIRWETAGNGNRLLLNGRDVTEAVRSPEVTRAASVVAAHPEVRAPLVERQRALAQQGGLVMEGRDIGTVVFPDAPLKIFLDAAPEVRGRRRLKDAESAALTDSDVVAREIRERDRRDATREASPLRPAPDAVCIDTTHLTVADVVRRVVELARSRGLSGLEKAAGNR